MDSAQTQSSTVHSTSAPNSVSIETKLAVESRRIRCEHLLFWTLIFQFIAPLLIWLTFWIPPTIGFGRFSIPIDFRLLKSFLIGGILAQVVLAAYFLALGTPNIWRRLLLFGGFLICAFFANLVGAMAFLAVGNSRFDFSDLIELSKASWLVIAFLFGLPIIAWIVRIYRGKKLQIYDDQKQVPVTRSETATEFIVMIAIVAFIFFGMITGTLIDGTDGFSSLASITIVLATILGIALFPIALWIFGAKSNRSLLIAISSIVGLIVIPTAICGYISDYVNVDLLIPVGNGQFFFPVSFMFAILLLQMILIRGMGYRLINVEFESKLAHAKAQASEAVVDPFGD